MENIYQPSNQKSLTALHILAAILFILIPVYLENSGLNLSLIIVQATKEFFSHNWLPLEFCPNGNCGKDLHFFIGEIFVYYLILNINLGPNMLLAGRMNLRRPHNNNYLVLDTSKKLNYLQAIFVVFRLYQCMVIATFLSICALYISLVIYQGFCRLRWNARGSKEETEAHTLYLEVVGKTFPEEAESMAIFIYTILCLYGYIHIPNLKIIFLLIGLLSYLIRSERLLMILIGILSLNLPIFLLAIMNSRPLSNFAKNECKNNSPNLGKYYNVHHINLKKPSRENDLYYNKKKVQKIISGQSSTNRKTKNRIDWSKNNFYI